MSFYSKLVSIFQTESSSGYDLDIENKKPLARQAKRYSYRVELDLDKLRNAIIAAENPIYPQRTQLYLLYNRAIEDDHLLSQIRTARFNIQMSDYVLKKDNVESPELTEIIDKPWFFKYIEFAVDSEFFGHSLVEFMKDKEGLVSEVILFPRENVRPEDELIVYNAGDVTGISYTENEELKSKVQSIGDKYDLGLLKSLTKAVTRKDYNLTDWGRRNEKFGMPHTILKTASRNENELNSKQSMMENFGSSMWAIIDDQDSIELKEAISNTGGGHKSFLDYVNFLDSAISVLVNGQVATSQENAYVGSSEVQERQLNKYTLARMRRIQYHINYSLIPYLVTLGYPFENCLFCFKDLEKSEQKNNTPTSKKEDETTNKL